mmetsp:Transcript_1886/g.2953  ORF Transcript_1886/g.2953 Transcript_1886/m.2953 type:complete len:284 (+) Transcript_1886:180-1031(+)|eukprot:CAMPEP_0196141706 /NCGR_PEP_ID=MMETSP0910-20130528/10291_1 /TAXON_ID=49265 /ORGANISM="Thalassiosira rotula, Strain GSO102" /LENGTH=283 /DNA_ID=CAMNT_0041402901 /DNA_START=181 /DNA_END=1032 /DNA_ORIENTATION=-
MAKFKKFKKLIPGKDKNKAKVSEEASPLMADSTKSKSSTSSPRLEVENDKEREEKKRQRDERRKQRDQRLADSKTTKESSSKTKKKKSKPKLTQEEQDEKDAKLGCCHYFQEILVKIVHVIDAVIGLTFLIYGILINNFENPAIDAVISCMAFGATMLFTSIMGAIGFYTKLCWRVGLLFSAYTAVLIAFFYTFIIIALLGGKDIYFDYLKENKSVMYLDDNEIAILQQILPFFYIALASLAAIETVRFFTLRKLRGKLVRSDAASVRISARLAEPLIGDEQV